MAILVLHWVLTERNISYTIYLVKDKHMQSISEIMEERFNRKEPTTEAEILKRLAYQISVYNREQEHRGKAGDFYEGK